MSDYVNHEPPCGWLKLQSLFIQKSAYLITHVDWDNEPVNFESLAQIVDYGKRALRECLERKHETDALKAQRDELIGTIEELIKAYENMPNKSKVHCGDLAQPLTKAAICVAKAKGE